MIRTQILTHRLLLPTCSSRTFTTSARFYKQEASSSSSSSSSSSKDQEKLKARAPKLDETEADHPDSSQRVRNLGHELVDEFSVLRDKYKAPQNPIVLCHGLFGFDEMRLLPGDLLPGIEYWRGIREALELQDVETIIATVPPSGSIEQRAEALAEIITKNAGGRKVNLIGHSMGGLDARYLISRLSPNTFTPLSLTTIATPHHGSPVADYIFSSLPPASIPKLYSAFNTIGLDTGAFEQLTTRYMTEEFNTSVPDVKGVGYYSYGARFDGKPKPWSWFRWSWGIIEEEERKRAAAAGVRGEGANNGDADGVEGAAARAWGNDGLVSVESAKWGTYEGTVVGVSHLEVVNWYNRAEHLVGGWLGRQQKFNGIAFYCAMVEKLAGRGY